MAIYGYGRCSTNKDKQDVDRQKLELVNAGVPANNIILEYEHGTAEHKQQQEILFKALQAGDTLTVTEVSRLTRSTKQLCDIINLMQQKHVRLEILNSVTIDCRTGELDPMTKAFLQMAGVFAELEREMISARVKSGIENAKAKGKEVGRPATNKDRIPEIFYKYYPGYKAGKYNKTELAKLTELTRPTIDKYIRIAEGR